MDVDRRATINGVPNSMRSWIADNGLGLMKYLRHFFENWSWSMKTGR
jgi:hypothetical protein